MSDKDREEVLLEVLERNTVAMNKLTGTLMFAIEELLKNNSSYAYREWKSRQPEKKRRSRREK